MKKWILALVALVVAVGCMEESTFTATNYSDFAVFSQGLFLTDSGYSFKVTENASGTTGWEVEGKRFHLLCDILNRDLDIRLKNLNPVTIKDALPYQEDQPEPDDPVAISASLGSGYLNMIIVYSYNPSSNYSHKVDVYWEARGSNLNLYLLHDGNHENSVYMDSSSLKQETLFYSIPLTEILATATFDTISLTLYEIEDLSSGESKIARNTYYLASGGNL